MKRQTWTLEDPMKDLKNLCLFTMKTRAFSACFACLSCRKTPGKIRKTRVFPARFSAGKTGLSNRKMACDGSTQSWVSWVDPAPVSA